MTQPELATRIPKPRPAPLGAKETKDVPRHWFLGLAFPTHVSNGVNLLFPIGERFFVKSVRRFEHRIDDPVLLAKVKGFYGQEGRHAKAHEDVIQMLRDQGYEVDRFLRVYERVMQGFLERVLPPELSLAGTAAAEHFTAIMAKGALTFRFLDAAHPAMRDLLFWHAAEEIEHKSVAFDVLQKIAPSYAVRMTGLALATITLSTFWAVGTAMLLAQEDESLRAMWEKAKAARTDDRTIFRDVFLRGILDYARRDFHPDDDDDYALAGELLRSMYGDAAGAA